jgi:endo-1,4-beta-mannosidase
MWQKETFDPETIQQELEYARKLGFNTARIYLHDLAWTNDPKGFKNRINIFLNITSQLGITPMLVFFDDCWNTDFTSGRQPNPIPGIHNSGWIQSPGTQKVIDKSTWNKLEEYVKDVFRYFRNDNRILMWDLYNEPGNNKLGVQSLGLLETVFKWSREVDPSQPISVGVWYDNPQLNKFQLNNSDIITFHNYHDAQNLENQIQNLKRHDRPMICTEYMARTRGSRFETHLPIFKRENIGCISWGLVSGKTQTIYPWGSKLGISEPKTWFHDIFKKDGTPYSQKEMDFIQKTISKEN